MSYSGVLAWVVPLRVYGVWANCLAVDRGIAALQIASAADADGQGRRGAPPRQAEAAAHTSHFFLAAPACDLSSAGGECAFGGRRTASPSPWPRRCRRGWCRPASARATARPPSPWLPARGRSRSGRRCAAHRPSGACASPSGAPRGHASRAGWRRCTSWTSAWCRGATTGPARRLVRPLVPGVRGAAAAAAAGASPHMTGPSPRSGEKGKAARALEWQPAHQSRVTADPRSSSRRHQLRGGKERDGHCRTRASPARRRMATNIDRSGPCVEVGRRRLLLTGTPKRAPRPTKNLKKSAPRFKKSAPRFCRPHGGKSVRARVSGDGDEVVCFRRAATPILLARCVDVQARRVSRQIVRTAPLHPEEVASRHGGVATRQHPGGHRSSPVNLQAPGRALQEVWGPSTTRGHPSRSRGRVCISTSTRRWSRMAARAGARPPRARASTTSPRTATRRRVAPGVAAVELHDARAGHRASGRPREELLTHSEDRRQVHRRNRGWTRAWHDLARPPPLAESCSLVTTMRNAP